MRLSIPHAVHHCYFNEPGAKYRTAKANDDLVAKYLHRDYSTPVEGYADARFDLLKCVDMYHSRELDHLMRKYVPHPDWIGDKPAKKVRK